MGLFINFSKDRAVVRLFSPRMLSGIHLLIHVLMELLLSESISNFIYLNTTVSYSEDSKY